MFYKTRQAGLRPPKLSNQSLSKQRCHPSLVANQGWVGRDLEQRVYGHLIVVPLCGRFPFERQLCGNHYDDDSHSAPMFYKTRQAGLRPPKLSNQSLSKQRCHPITHRDQIGHRRITVLLNRT